ncbi:MAG: hypothetical protein GY830_03165 [Bacteroidetes bacterium]|nr:hypothetical protein [Bacteroidota bacterium]
MILNKLTFLCLGFASIILFRCNQISNNYGMQNTTNNLEEKKNDEIQLIDNQNLNTNTLNFPTPYNYNENLFDLLLNSIHRRRCKSLAYL